MKKIVIDNTRLAELNEQRHRGSRLGYADILGDLSAIDDDSIMIDIPRKTKSGYIAVPYVDYSDELRVDDNEAANYAKNRTIDMIKDIIGKLPSALMRTAYVCDKLAKSSEYNTTLISLNKELIADNIRKWCESDDNAGCKGPEQNVRIILQLDQDAAPTKMGRFKKVIRYNTLFDTFDPNIDDLDESSRAYVTYSLDRQSVSEDLLPTTFAEEYRLQKQMVNSVLEKALILPKIDMKLYNTIDLSGESNVIRSDK